MPHIHIDEETWQLVETLISETKRTTETTVTNEDALSVILENAIGLTTPEQLINRAENKSFGVLQYEYKKIIEIKNPDILRCSSVLTDADSALLLIYGPAQSGKLTLMHRLRERYKDTPSVLFVDGDDNDRNTGDALASLKNGYNVAALVQTENAEEARVLLLNMLAKMK